MDASNLVAPAANADPSVSPQAAATPPAADNDASTTPSLPDSLTKVPAIQGLLVGAPPAVSAQVNVFEHSELGKEIAANKDALLAAGFGFYKSMHGGLGVIFNRFHIHGEDLKAADKAGKLQILAPSIEQVDHALAKTGGKHMLGKAIPTGFASATPQAAVQPGAQAAQGIPSSLDAPSAAPMAGGASGALAKRLQGARLANQSLGAPTSGPAPGAGRLLNSILKPVV
jgi:hypothetical protein